MKKGLFHTLLISLLATLGLLTSLTVAAKTSLTSHAPALDNSGSLISPQKTVGGPYSSNRLKGSSRRKFTPRNRNKIRIKSQFPRKLGIANYDVVWKVKKLSGGSTHHARGKIASLSLSPGKYRITMRIGKYTEKKTINIRRSRNNVQTFSMPINAGLLKVNTGSAKHGNAATIKVTNSRGKVVASSKGKPIKRLLKSGKYVVTYHYGNKKKGRNVVHVTNGAIKETRIKVPASGKVRISALKKGNQPLMKSSSWVITDSRGKVVKRTKRHTLRLTLFSGTYTAHLTVAGKKKSKTFKVKAGRSSTVKIHL